MNDSSKFDEKGCFLKKYENYEYGRPLGILENILKLNENLEIKNVKLNLRKSYKHLTFWKQANASLPKVVNKVKPVLKNDYSTIYHFTFFNIF